MEMKSHLPATLSAIVCYKTLIDATNGVIYSMSNDLLSSGSCLLPFASEPLCWKQQNDFGKNSDMSNSGQPSW